MKYFFWIAFAVFLAASIPHVAYFFASFEPSNGPEGIWWWCVSYAIAISIDVTVYLLSWTAFQRYRKYRTPKAVWQHWLLIVMCTIFSWAVNWAYAKQFHSTSMLSSAETAAPWLTNVFPFMASAFPLLGIVYTMMAETITESAAEVKKGHFNQFQALGEMARQTQLPIASLRRALMSGRLAPSVLTEGSTHSNSEMVPATTTVEDDKAEKDRPITGKFVTLEGNHERASREPAAPTVVAVTTDGNQDKLQMTIEALRAKPDMTDEALAEFLSLKRPASARFWRLKAIEILNTPEKDFAAPSTITASSWSNTGTLVNSINTKR